MSFVQNIYLITSNLKSATCFGFQLRLYKIFNILYIKHLIPRPRPFENRVLRRIFEPERDEVTGEWRRLCNEEMYALYTSLYVIWVIK
jgi:hypothetical protein